MKLEQLIYRHPHHKKNLRHWQILDAMVKGGSAMSTDIKREILANPDRAVKETYDERVKLANFDSVMGVIVMKLASQVLMDQASYEGLKGQEWTKFFASCGLASDPINQTVDQLSFHGVLSRSLIEGLTTGRAIAQIGEEDGQPIVTFRPQSALWDWQKNGKEFDVAKIYDYEETRDSWVGEPIPTHRFTFFWRDRDRIYASVYCVKPRDVKKNPQFTIADLENAQDKDVIIETEVEELEVFSTTRGVSRFPVVNLSLPSQLVIADCLYDLQKSYFNHVLGGEWAMLQTNFAQLVFTGVEDPHTEGNANKAKTKLNGDGHYWECGPGQDVKWLIRSPDGIQLTVDYQKELRSRMLEMIHTVAESASNYAAKYQSGESKREQRRPLDVLFEVFGQCIRDYAKQILDVASIVTNSDQEWVVKGFTDYHTDGLMEWLEDYLKLDEAGIDSPTLKREAQKAIASKAVEQLNIDPSVLAAIEEELSTDPFNLNDSQRDTLVRLAQYGEISRFDLFTVLKAAGDLPHDFDIEAAIARIEGQPIRQDLPPDTVLSNGQNTTEPITETTN